MSALPADVRDLLVAPNVAHIATVLPDGSPHSVPTWIGVEGDHVAFLTSPTSVKARNLDRDPRISISVTAADEPTRMAQVRGRVAEVLDGERGWEIIDRISHAYTGAPYPLRDDRVIFLVAADRAWAQAFG